MPGSLLLLAGFTDVPDKRKIVFLCDTIAPGKSGVGDYTVALSKALKTLGYESGVISLMEKDNPGAAPDFPVLCLSASQTWSTKASLAGEWLAKEKPDILSLQFVPYAYQSRGLPLGLSPWLNSLGQDCSWHIMFHELWVAAEKNAPLKNCVIGIIQKRLILSMLQKLDPRYIHTSNAVYQELLAREGVQAGILPLFSNFNPVTQTALPRLAFRELDFLFLEDEREHWLVACIFGTVHPQWEPRSALKLLKKAAELSGKRPALLLLGKSGPEGIKLVDAVSCQKEKIFCFKTGPLNPEPLSSLLFACDFGFSTTPWALAGKSGAAKALLAHQLPLVFTDDRWRLSGGSTPLPEGISGCYLDSPGLAQRIADGLPRPARPYMVEQAAEQLYQSIDTDL